jgi:hypothetical protein
MRPRWVHRRGMIYLKVQCPAVCSKVKYSTLVHVWQTTLDMNRQHLMAMQALHLS